MKLLPKLLSISVIYTVFFIPKVVTAQESDTAKTLDKNVLSVDIFRGLTRDSEIYRWLIQYERALNGQFSIVGGFETGQYQYYSTSITPISTGSNSPNITEEYTVSGSMLLLEGRVYPFNKNKKSPRGFFFGTYFKHFWLEEKLERDDNNGFTEDQSINAFGVDFGHQFFNDWFMLEPVIGFGGGTDSGIGNNSKVDDQMGSFEMINYTLRFSINVGVCF